MTPTFSLSDVGDPPHTVVRVTIGKARADIPPADFDATIITLQRLCMAARTKDATRRGPAAYERLP